MSFRDIPRELLGEEYDRKTYPAIEADELTRYARTLGVTDPIYLDEDAARSGPFGGLVAFPTYVVKLRGGKHMPDAAVRALSKGGFDAGKDIAFGAPIRPGDVLTTSSAIHEIYEKTGRSGAMVFLVFRTEIHNQRGEMVAIVDARMMQKA